jgi:hypothetical protein
MCVGQLVLNFLHTIVLSEGKKRSSHAITANEVARPYGREQIATNASRNQKRI